MFGNLLLRSFVSFELKATFATAPCVSSIVSLLFRRLGVWVNLGGPKQACADLVYIVGGAEHGQRWW